MAFTFMEIPKREFLRLKIFRSMLSLRNILETLIESGMIGGDYFALVGEDGPDSFQKRSIHASSLYKKYSEFEFDLKKLGPEFRIETGIVYPWFDSPGGSRQVRIYKFIETTEEKVYLSAADLLADPPAALVRKTAK